MSATERTPAERVTSVISVLVLVVILGIAGWTSARTGESPPVIEVEAHLGDVRERDSGYYVPITIINAGGLTAQDVVVTGELDTGEGTPETADVTIAFLSGGETEDAELIFSANPNAGEFAVRPTSYLNP